MLLFFNVVQSCYNLPLDFARASHSLLTQSSGSREAELPDAIAEIARAPGSARGAAFHRSVIVASRHLRRDDGCAGPPGGRQMRAGSRAGAGDGKPKTIELRLHCIKPAKAV